MIRITLSPCGVPIETDPVFNPLSVVHQSGDLIINGVTYPFSKLQEGETLPYGSISCPYVFGDVFKIDGVLNLCLVFPIGYDAPHDARFPELILVIEDGPVTLPNACWPPVKNEQPKGVGDEG